MNSERVRACVLVVFLTLLPLALLQSDYQSMQGKADALAVTRRPLSKRLLVVLIDGLPAYAVYQEQWMPWLRTQLSRSAHGIAVAPIPSLTPPGLRAIFAGRDSAPSPEIPGAWPLAPEPDSVFARARDARLATHIVGYEDWTKLFGGHGANMSVVSYHGGWPLANDARTLAKAERILGGREGPWNLLALHFYDLDSIGHARGVGSASYTERLIRLDRTLARITRLAGPETTVLVLADHGQTRDGIHGGGEAGARQVPFILWGPRIRPVPLGQFPLAAAAPTMSALLGVPPPAYSDQDPLLQALNVSTAERAAILIETMRQRIRFWEATEAARGRTVVFGHAEGALTAWREGRHADAADKAQAALTEVNRLLKRAAPKTWVLWLMVTLLLLIAASLCSTIWRQSSPSPTLPVVAGCLLFTAMIASSIAPSLWRWSAPMCAGLAALLFVLSAAPGRDRAGMDWGRWLLLWVTIASIGFSEVLDPPAFAWIAALLLALIHLYPRKGLTALERLAPLIILTATGILAVTEEAPTASLVRSFLPIIRLPPLSNRAWSVILLAVAGAIFARYFALRRRRLSALALASVAVPLLAACCLKGAHAAVWTWVACLLSAVVLRRSRVSAVTRTLWVGVLLFTYSITMSGPKSAAFLGLAMFVGWELSLRSFPVRGPWLGAKTAALAIFGYTLSGGFLDFSHVSIREAYDVLDVQYRPGLLIVLVGLKHCAALALAAFPLLRRRSYLRLAHLPFFGALAAGNLAWMWATRFVSGMGASAIASEVSFERILWAAAAPYALQIVWVLSLPVRSFSPRPYARADLAKGAEPEAPPAI